MRRRPRRPVGSGYASTASTCRSRYYHGTRGATLPGSAPTKNLLIPMGREGFEPSTLGLRVPCSTN